jgi:hypothetical protein
MTGHLRLPGFPPTLVAVINGLGKPDVLDQPDDEPSPDETLHLYAFSSVAYLDYRGKQRAQSGRYGLYFHVAAGEYVCLDCGATLVSPPVWPFERCNVWKSGFHRLAVEAPLLMERVGG